MTAVDLKGLYRVHIKASGKTYYYAWRGGPRIKADPGTPEFLVAFVELTKKQPDQGKIDALVVDYKSSDTWKRVADSTKRVWSPWLDRIRDDLGKLTIKFFDKPESRQVIKRWRNRWKATPRTADTAKQVLSVVLSYAVEDGLIGSNPCSGISNLYSSDRSEIIFTPEDIAKIAAIASPEVLWALKLACLTGLRKGDLMRLEWRHINDLCIDMNTSKSRGKRIALIPLYDELRALLAEIPHRAATVLTNSDGDPWKGFSSSWTPIKKKAGLAAMHFHDARGTAATRFYIAGLPLEEIAEILAWEKSKVERIINRYVRRDALLRARIARLNEAAANT